MKKLSYLVCLLIGAVLSFGVSSCGSNGSNEEPNRPETGKINQGGGNQQTPETQKKQIETTAKKIIGFIHTDDFKELDAITYRLNHYYLSNQKVANVRRWADDIVESLTQSIETGKPNEKEYARIIDASRFKGHFEFKDGVWKRTRNAEVLEFQFEDKDNKECLLSLSTSGKSTEVNSKYFNDVYKEWGYYHSTTTTYKNKVVVPENITLLLKQGGEDLVRTNIQTTLNTKGELNPTIDVMEVNCETRFRAYEVNVKRAYYKGPGLAEVNLEVRSDGKTLVKANVNAVGRLSNERIESVGTVNVNVDLLGEIQIKGACKDGSRFSEIYKDLENNRGFYYNERKFKEATRDANEQLNLNVYMNNNKSEVARLLLKAFSEKRNYVSNNEIWYVEPAIQFNDETAYAMSEYFTKNAFPDVFREINNMVNTMRSLFQFN